jgi:hypothetical protein
MRHRHRGEIANDDLNPQSFAVPAIMPRLIDDKPAAGDRDLGAARIALQERQARNRAVADDDVRSIASFDLLERLRREGESGSEKRE